MLSRLASLAYLVHFFDVSYTGDGLRVCRDNSTLTMSSMCEMLADAVEIHGAFVPNGNIDERSGFDALT